MPRRREEPNPPLKKIIRISPSFFSIRPKNVCLVLLLWLPALLPPFQPSLSRQTMRK